MDAQPIALPVRQLPVNSCGHPSTTRVVMISSSAGAGRPLVEALAADPHMQIDDIHGIEAGFARLTDGSFDAAIVTHSDDLDALTLVASFRSTGSDHPLIVLGDAPHEAMEDACNDVAADGYHCIHTSSAQALHRTLMRAVQRVALVRESQQRAENARVDAEEDKQTTQRQLIEQRLLVEPPTAASLPKSQVRDYHDLLRTYVMMSPGGLTVEISAMAEGIITRGETASDFLRLHVHVVEETVRRLGKRSARHVLDRASLLAIELCARLADGYRQHSIDPARLPRRLDVPVIDAGGR